MAFRITCPNCKERITIETAGSSTIVCPKCKCAYLINIIRNGDKHELESLRLLFNPKDVKRIDIIKDKWKHLSTKVKIGIPVSLIVIIACVIGWYIYTRPCPIEETMAYADMESLWKEFRDKNPYNFQTVGIKEYDDNSYTMILSEPSEMVSVKDLQQIFEKYNCKLDTFKCGIGYDGWLKDAVLCFNGIKKKKLPKLTSNLFKLLYGTDYKAELLDLDTIPEHTAFSTHNLNYQVSAEEIHNWFVDNREPMINVSDTTKETYILDALNDYTHDSDLYYSKDPGFVIWVIRRSSSLESEDFRVKARMFALDSDLILGAISNSGHVAIIARERSIPIYELPPMRQETLLMLASTKKAELSQSYERNNLFAGKLPGGKDYAPILLSDELWHTEYGNILNITDQMLKSWSENGNVEYHAFSYPKPLDWAFSDGVHTDLGTSKLTYNWNTAGAGYIIDEEDDYKVYAVNRTGSLPISYIPGETNKITVNNPIFRAEEKSYDFYSNLSNAELVKVVQYTSMYQIFCNFGIHVYGYDFIKEDVSVVPDTLYVLSEVVLSKIANINQDDVIKIANKYKLTCKDIDSRPRLFCDDWGREYEIPLINSLDSLSLLLKKIGKYSVIPSLARSLVDREYIISYSYERPRTNISQLDLEQFLKDWNQKEKKQIDPFDDMPAKDKIDYVIKEIHNRITDIKEFINYTNILSKEDAKELYLQINKNKCFTWQKSPTIVESWLVKDSVFSVGGHNLDSKITPIKISESLKAGEYKVSIDESGHKVIEITASDKGRVTPTFLRNVERTGIKGTMKFNKPSGVVRERNVVLSPTVKRTSRGFNRADHLTIGREGDNNYTINGKKSGFTVEDLIKDATDKLDNGEAHTSVTLEFKSICEDECMAIVEKLGNVRLKKSNAFSKIPCRALDAANIITEDIGNGNVRVKLAVKAEEVKNIIAEENIQKASIGGTRGKKTFWSRVKEVFIVFEMPKSMVKDFVTFLQKYIKENTIFRRFDIRHGARQNGFMIQDEIDGLKVAEMINYQKKYYNELVLEEKKVA